MAKKDDSTLILLGLGVAGMAVYFLTRPKETVATTGKMDMPPQPVPRPSPARPSPARPEPVDTRPGPGVVQSGSLPGRPVQYQDPSSYTTPGVAPPLSGGGIDFAAWRDAAQGAASNVANAASGLLPGIDFTAWNAASNGQVVPVAANGERTNAQLGGFDPAEGAVWRVATAQDPLNIRSEPRVSAPRLGGFNPGDLVQQTGDPQNGFVPVRGYANEGYMEGYVSLTYLTRVA